MISFKDFGVACVVKEWKFLYSANPVVVVPLELFVIDIELLSLELLSFSLDSLISASSFFFPYRVANVLPITAAFYNTNDYETLLSFSSTKKTQNTFISRTPPLYLSSKTRILA